MTKEYTSLRQIYAWVGFVTIVFLSVKGIAWFIWAHQFLAANGY